MLHSPIVFVATFFRMCFSFPVPLRSRRVDEFDRNPVGFIVNPNAFHPRIQSDRDPSSSGRTVSFTFDIQSLALSFCLLRVREIRYVHFRPTIVYLADYANCMNLR
jgi:hypothetical protein